MKKRSGAGLRARVGAIFVILAATVAVVDGCNGQNSIVGGACVTGYVACADQCVNTAVDPANCGSCDVVCPSGVACLDGLCGGPVDGSSDGSALGDGSSGDGSAGDGSFGDGGDGGCEPPFNRSSACGACDVVCVAPNSACLADPSGNFVCAPPCTPPLVECENACVDTQTDPLNCGVCGKFCPSNLCANGVCQGATPGDVVVLGHDYSSGAAGSSQAKVLTNAVFIPPSNPLRVLSYEQFADAAAVARVKSLVQSAAFGRTVVFTPSTTSADLASPTLAQSYDVVLVYDQQGGAPANLTTIGASWVTSLSDFAKAGGVIVALDGAAGQGGMPQLLTSAGLLAVGGHQTIPAGTPVAVVAPADRIGAVVASPYGVYNRSVSLQAVEPEGPNVIYVAKQLVNGTPANPVVVHKIVNP
ncbi:Tryptophan synthase alpha chain [Labilithrix luteola]|uniref:Tryptophan synthase alpha chain n=1 Tax=Labilithrix luteola TaxID=1391654 RepID=A0A0K1QEF0_9BACT|nr:hypothetical protein [Labilithrix luteola]AKV04108.1 Tryptophan synthase alpha chain [Labilithrix luteola]